MRSAITILCGAAAVIASWGGASALPINRWIGNWELDETASRLRGDIIMIAKADRGYRFDFGAVNFVIVDDGLFHSTVAGRTTSLTPVDKFHWKRAHRLKGVVVDRSMLSISKDERLLTITTSTAGRSATVETLQRIGQGVGLAGVWRSTKPGVNVSKTLTIGRAERGWLQWGSPADGNFYVVVADGTPAANQGPTSVPGVTLQLRQVSPRQLRWVELINSKPYRNGTDTLSGDDDILTEISWPAALPTEKQIAVYRRGSRAAR